MARTRAELAHDIDHQRFTPTRARGGYAMADVDAFLDRLSAAVRAGEDVSLLVDAARFTTVRLREGYDMAEVDQFLDEVVAAAGPATAPAPLLERDTHPAATAAADTTGPATTGPNVEVIDQIRGARFGSRMLAEGYDKAAVDTLLDQLIQRLGAGTTFDDLILARLPRRRGGYTVAEVDALLDKIRYGARYS